MPTKQKTLTEQLCDAIAASGQSRYRIAQETGVAESSLSRFVSGERGLSIQSLEKLLDYLSLEVLPKRQGKGK
ncbi:MAG: helix-turn-helix transcriptional regulator [Planctomycetaceae bacterium]|nr:helix-turn-helix transcriptional regulator [Planctomycetaceae bacterium]